MGRRRRSSNQRHTHYVGGEPHGLNPGDDVGNRRGRDEKALPPDDIGNRREDAPDFLLPPDDVGNRVDGNPTHDLSGVLADLAGKKGGGRARRVRGAAPQVRVGRYVIGGVNPVVSADTFRAQKAQEADFERRRGEPRRESAPSSGGNGAASHDAERRLRRVDGGDERAAAAPSERRPARFFDFEEDDRFEYTLKTSPEEKRAAACDAVAAIVDGADRDATVTARVVEDGARPKVLVAIDERGPHARLPAERRGNASSRLFSAGSPALMSVNYLVNKIVNRFPDDRIRLSVLPASEIEPYLEALARHRGAAPSAAEPSVSAPTRDEGTVEAPVPEIVIPLPAVAAEVVDEDPPAPAEAPEPAKRKRPARAAKTAEPEPEPAEAPAKRKTTRAAKKAPEVELAAAPLKKAAPKAPSKTRATKKSAASSTEEDAA